MFGRVDSGARERRQSRSPRHSYSATGAAWLATFWVSSHELVGGCPRCDRRVIARPSTAAPLSRTASTRLGSSSCNLSVTGADQDHSEQCDCRTRWTNATRCRRPHSTIDAGCPLPLRPAARPVRCHALPASHPRAGRRHPRAAALSSGNTDRSVGADRLRREPRHPQAVRAYIWEPARLFQSVTSRSGRPILPSLTDSDPARRRPAQAPEGAEATLIAGPPCSTASVKSHWYPSRFRCAAGGLAQRGSCIAHGRSSGTVGLHVHFVPSDLQLSRRSLR